MTKTVKLDEIGYRDKLPCPVQSDIRHDTSNLKIERSLVCQVDTEGATRVLIVSDDVIGAQATNETIVRCHLANTRKEIGLLSNTRKEISALKETMTSLTIGRDSLTKIAEGTGVPNDHDVAENIHRRANSDSIEYKLQELVDYDEG